MNNEIVIRKICSEANSVEAKVPQKKNQHYVSYLYVGAGIHSVPEISML
jgi:hypothetical protein